MTIASHLLRRRRVPALIAASVLLHCVAIGWVGQGLGIALAPSVPPAPNIIVAELLQASAAAPAAVLAQVAVPAPVRPAAQAARARPAPRAAAATQADDATEADAAIKAAEAAEVQASEAQEAERPAGRPEAGAAELAPQVQSDASAEAARQLEPLPAPGRKVSLPPPAELTLDVERTDAGGGKWSGQAVMTWSRDGSAYRMSVVASITMIVTINLVELASEGTVGEHGITPRTMTEKRRSKAATATHFGQGRITFSASPDSYPIVPGTQDKATFPMQLAGIARADPGKLGSDIELLVGQDKDASLFRFVVQGQEEIDTPMGRMAAWRLTRPPKPGSYSSRLDVWLAPGHEWYPVQIRSTEANGAVTTQTIRKIVIKETGT